MIIVRYKQFTDSEEDKKKKENIKLAAESVGGLGLSAALGIARKKNKEENLKGRNLKGKEDLSSLKVGDVIRIHDENNKVANIKDIDHHMIYIGDGKVASKYGGGVKVERLNTKFLPNKDGNRVRAITNDMLRVVDRPATSLTESEILDNVNKAVKSESKYNFINDNCEDFVNKMRGQKKGLSNTTKRHLLRTGAVAAGALGLVKAGQLIKNKVNSSKQEIKKKEN